MANIKHRLENVPERAVREAGEALYHHIKDGAVLIPMDADGCINASYKKLYSYLCRRDAFVILVSTGAQRFINVVTEHINTGIGNRSERGLYYGEPNEQQGRFDLVLS